MRVHAGDQRLLRIRHRVLRLHYFDVVCDASGEAVARLRQRLIRDIQVVPRHRHLVRRGLQIQQRRANIHLNMLVERSQLILALANINLSLRHIRVDTSAIENVHLHRSHKLERPCATAPD